MMSLQGELRIVQPSGNPKYFVRDFVRLAKFASSDADIADRKPKDDASGGVRCLVISDAFFEIDHV